MFILKSSEYHLLEVDKNIFSYKLFNKYDAPNTRFSYPEVELKDREHLPFKGFDLPNTMNVFAWSNIVTIQDSNYYIAETEGYNFHITSIDNSNYVEIKIKDNVVLSFTDHRATSDDTFLRELKNASYYYLDGKNLIKKKAV